MGGRAGRCLANPSDEADLQDLDLADPGDRTDLVFEGVERAVALVDHTVRLDEPDPEGERLGLDHLHDADIALQGFHGGGNRVSVGVGVRVAHYLVADRYSPHRSTSGALEAAAGAEVWDTLVAATSAATDALAAARAGKSGALLLGQRTP